ncbi:DUF3869 domain-containing protein [uncultured Bacteroides sp.]|uniref:DUF3869 domain-containing protein n=1 Tax=uncultured Bacteroides sp. TaxID=162156 RepID=UPI00260D1F82|nr:DUF3869 domain-containing protein [uncultured Bacteroides sp.]
MKKNFISSKVVIRSMAFTLLLTSMTGCYKDSRLDVNGPDSGTVTIPAAAYSISGTVTDAETGAAIENVTVTSDRGTLEGGNGAYNVKLTKDEVGEGTIVTLKFEAENYTSTTRSVYVQKINDGSTIVYPVSVSLKKEYVTISGYVTDVNNKMVAARRIRVNDDTVEPLYNSSTFSFKLGKKSGVSEYTVEAMVLDETGKKEITISETVKADAQIMSVNLKFGFAISDDGQVDPGDGTTGVLSPELNENGVTVSEVNTSMTDGTTVTIPQGTKIENLNGQTIVVFSHADNSASEGTDEGENNVILKTYTGLPDGVVFTPYLEVKFNDKYEGQLGNDFVLQYLNATDNTWATESKGGVELKDGAYSMFVPHFSTFRAALNMKSEVKIDTVSVTKTVDVNYENAEENPVNNYKLTYKEGKSGSQYADSEGLKNEISANFSNANAQALVQSSIDAIYPAASKGYQDAEYTGYVNIPAWTKLINYDVTTATERRSYTVEVNGKKISFVVETIISVTITVDDDNMTSIGHGHGHGDGNNNEGGGIVTGE